MPRKRNGSVSWGENESDKMETIEKILPITINEMEKSCKIYIKEFLKNWKIFVYKKEKSSKEDKYIFTIFVAPISIIRIDTKGLCINKDIRKISNSKILVNTGNIQGKKPILFFTIVVNNFEGDEDDNNKDSIFNIITKEVSDKINKIQNKKIKRKSLNDLKNILIVKDLKTIHETLTFNVRISLDHEQFDIEYIKDFAHGIVNSIVFIQKPTQRS